MTQMKDPLLSIWLWVRVQFFRIWTAVVVLSAYGYFWWNRPEYLTKWKKVVESFVDWSCHLIPYPWGDRIESTLGNFGLWVQITLAIVVFRALVGIIIMTARMRMR